MAVTQKDWSLGEAEKTAEDLIWHLDGVFERIELAGSVRRRRPRVHDLDFCCIPLTYGVPLDLFGTLKVVSSLNNALQDLGVEWTGGDRIHRFEWQGAEVDLYITDETNFALTWLIRTGSAEHNQYLCQLANLRGYSISYSEGLKHRQSGEVVLVFSETELFEILDLEFVKPELREAERCSGYPSFRPKYQQPVKIRL